MQKKSERKRNKKSRKHLTHYHMLAVLAIGGFAKDMVLETVVNLRSERFGGQ